MSGTRVLVARRDSDGDVLLGDRRSPCRDSQARTCPVPGNPCLNSVSAQEVVAALEQLLGEVAA
ncbi:MAG TPA: hypothetical protein VIL00_15285 [Pseudonocardiaceae bacterium]